MLILTIVHERNCTFLKTLCQNCLSLQSAISSIFVSQCWKIILHFVGDIEAITIIISRKCLPTISENPVTSEYLGQKKLVWWPLTPNWPNIEAVFLWIFHVQENCFLANFYNYTWTFGCISVPHTDDIEKKLKFRYIFDILST